MQKKFKLFFILMLLGIVSVNANAAIDSLASVTTLMDEIKTFFKASMGLFAMLLGYFMVLILPIIMFTYSNGKFKQKAEQDQGGDANWTITAKAAAIAVLTSMVGSVVIYVVFHVAAGVGTSYADTLNKVLIGDALSTSSTNAVSTSVGSI